MSLKKSQDKKLPEKKKQQYFCFFCLSLTERIVTVLKVNMSISLSKGIHRTDGTNNICKKWNNKFFLLVSTVLQSGVPLNGFNVKNRQWAPLCCFNPPLRTKKSPSTLHAFTRTSSQLVCYPMGRSQDCERVSSRRRLEFSS